MTHRTTRCCNVGTTNSGHDSSDDPTASRSNDIDPELVGLDNDTTTLDSSTNFGGGAALSCSCLIQHLLWAQNDTSYSFANLP